MSSSEHLQRLSEPRERGIFRAWVESNHPVCPDHYYLRIRLAYFPPSRAGQFINVLCGPDGLISADVVEWTEGRLPRLTGSETAGRAPLLRRPFSLAGRTERPDGSVELVILHRVVGTGTAWLASLEAGSEVDILGPLGNGFTIRDDKPHAVVIGGGTGIGPMIYLADALTTAGRKTTAFVGAPTAETLPLTIEQDETPSKKGEPAMCITEFAACSTPAVVTTDDGSIGMAGMVHQGFEHWFERKDPAPARHEQVRTADPVVYACGPEAMMNQIAKICEQRGMECQLALERHMACGMGLCQGCALKVKTNEPPGWKFKLVCKDGPVFDAGEIIWE